MYFGDNSFFANDENEALTKMSERCGCRVLPIVYPTNGERIYCISEHGELYGIRLIRGTGKYIGYGPLKVKKDRHRDQDITVKYDIYIDTDNTKLLAAEKLVYCTFVLQEWSDNLQLSFKDGNPLNVRLDNLEPYKKPVPQEWIERMENNEDVYQRYFNRVVDYVEYTCNVSEQDAKDIVQGTFLWIVTQKEGDQPKDFVGAWMKWARIRSTEYTRHYERVDCIDDYAELIGLPNVSYEVDLFVQIKNQKYQQMMRLYMQGYMQREIAEMYRTTKSTVATRISQNIRNLRKYVGKREIEFLRG